MTDWTEGYVADVPYALGFYREMVPAHIAFASLCVGKHPGLALKPKRVLELGFGMGLGFVINAAANPGIHFEGIDFNPMHVAHARGLVEDTGLTNASVREASFQDLAREAEGSQQDLDLIVLHGILTWVSSEAHGAIVEIARKRLKPGGLLYVSYNCMPGWAPMLPLRHLMRENAKRVGKRSDQRVSSGLELIAALVSENAHYLAANPTLAGRIEKISKLDKSYLAHEYLNANWHVFHFNEVSEMFARAKLGFIGSATLIENIDAMSLPESSRTRVGSELDPTFKEELRDLASNKQFRRDLFGRGLSNLTSVEHQELLSNMRFVLTVPRSKVTYKFQSPIGELDGNGSIYGAIADLLGEKPASFSEIAALPAFNDAGTNAALQAVALYVHSGQVLAAPPTENSFGFDPKPAQLLNKVIAERVLQGRTYNFLAVPAAGSGIQATHGELLMFAAILASTVGDVEAIVEHVIYSLQRLRVTWQVDGKPVADASERQAVVREDVKLFLSEKIPLWKRLGVL